MPTHDFTQLDVWKKAHQITLMTYRLTAGFPRAEIFRLTDQACKSSASVATNISEGYGRRSPGEKMRFYNIAEGSLQELKYQFILARDLGYVRDAGPVFDLIRDVEMMLRKLIAAISRGPAPSSP